MDVQADTGCHPVSDKSSMASVYQAGVFTGVITSLCSSPAKCIPFGPPFLHQKTDTCRWRSQGYMASGTGRGQLGSTGLCLTL